jgi:hypothetical protein
MLQISFLGMMSPNDHNEQELGRSEPGGYTSFHSETLQPRADWKCISCVIDTNTYYDIWSCYKRGGTALNLWPCCFFEYHVKLQGESVELGFFYSWTPQRIGSFTNKRWWLKMGKHTVDLLVNKSFLCIRIGYLWWRGRNSTPPRACRLVIFGWPSQIGYWRVEHSHKLQHMCNKMYQQ